MKNKKVLIIAAVAVVLVVAIVLAVVLIAGGQKETPVQETQYALGMGVEFGDLTNSQINATVATVVLDGTGKIVACRIDTVQNKYTLEEGDEEEEVEPELVFTNLKTKMELGNDYGMAAHGTSLVGNTTVKEWYEQAKAFENWVVGKTVTEVRNMKTQRMDNGYVIADEKDLLDAGCTIAIEEFRDAVVKACRDSQGTTFKTAGTFTLGIAVNSANDGSSVEEDGGYTVKMNVEFAAAVVVNGKVVATLNDAMQPVVVVNAKGEVKSRSVGKGEGILQSKRELKENYGMEAAAVDKNGDGKSYEWYKQSEIYSNYVVGKTATEIAGLELGTDLQTAGCTIYIGGINAVVAKAATNAR